MICHSISWAWTKWSTISYFFQNIFWYNFLRVILFKHNWRSCQLIFQKYVQGSLVFRDMTSIKYQRLNTEYSFKCESNRKEVIVSRAINLSFVQSAVYHFGSTRTAIRDTFQFSINGTHRCVNKHWRTFFNWFS